MFALLVKPTVAGKRTFRQVLTHFDETNVHFIQTHTPADIRAEVQALCEQHDDVTVVACGGDGTVHLLINSVFGLPVTFGVIPMGTGNDFARHLGIRTVASGVAAVRGDAVHLVDVGSISLADGSKRKFLGIASCGFDAQVNERANRLRGPQGTLKYVAAMLGELRELKPIAVSVSANGSSTDQTLTLLAVGNTSSYGGGMKVCPAADMSDGVFDISQVQAVSRRMLLRVFPRVFRGTHVQHPAVTVFQTAAIQLTGAPFAIYADGERIGHGPATLEISPQALRVKTL